jgi:hypothetical protein
VSDPFVARVLWALGRREEALASARREEERVASVPMMRGFSLALRAAIEGHREEGAAAIKRLHSFGFSDGEGLFYLAGLCARLGEPELGHELLSRAVDLGFVCLRAFETDVYLTSLRSSDAWPPLMERLNAKRRLVTNEFMRAGGRALLAVD